MANPEQLVHKTNKKKQNRKLKDGQQESHKKRSDPRSCLL